MTVPTNNAVAKAVNAPCVCTDPEADRLRVPWEAVAAWLDERAEMVVLAEQTPSGGDAS